MIHDGWYSLALAEADRADRLTELLYSMVTTHEQLLNELRQFRDVSLEEERLAEMKEELLAQ